MPKDNLSLSKSGNNLRERSPRHKHHSKSSQQQNRDSLKIVNEKNVANLQATEQEEDSETENLSPLLNSKNNKKSHVKLSKKPSNNTILTTSLTSPVQPPIAGLHMDGVHEPIDDADTDLEDHRGAEVIEYLDSPVNLVWLIESFSHQIRSTNGTLD